MNQPVIPATRMGKQLNVYCWRSQMAQNDIDNTTIGPARTVEVFHIEEAVRQAQLARSRMAVRVPIRDRGIVESVNPVGLAGAETQGGTPVVTDEPHETWEEEEYL